MIIWSFLFAVPNSLVWILKAKLWIVTNVSSRTKVVGSTSYRRFGFFMFSIYLSNLSTFLKFIIENVFDFCSCWSGFSPHDLPRKVEKSSNREVKSKSRNYIASFTKADFSPHISPVEEPRRISKMVLQLESFRPEIVNAQSKYKLRRVC